MTPRCCDTTLRHRSAPGRPRSSAGSASPARSLGGRVSRLAALPLAVVLLGGCGSDGGDAQPAAASGPAASASASATASTTPASGGTATTGGAAQTTDTGATTSAGGDVDSVQTDTPPAEAALVMTFAEYSAGTGTFDGSAFAQGLVEAGGTCVLSATRDGDAPLTGTPTPAEAGPGTTDCGSLALEVPAGGSGTWTVSVGYESDSTSLTSNSMEVAVP